MQRQSSANNLRRRKLILKAVRCLAALLLVGAIALFEYLCPFRSLLPAATVTAREEGELRLHFLYAGRGDCTVVEFPEGDLLVVDGGDGAFDSKVCRYVKGLNPQTVTVIVTNPRDEHTGGLAEIVSSFAVGEIYLPAIGTETGSYQRLLAAAQKRGCETKKLTRYGVISRPSGAYLVCLSPYAVDETDIDDASTMLYLQYAGVRVLLCSDTTRKREAHLQEEYALESTIFNSGAYEVRLDRIDILKVAAHGAEGSAEWLSLLNPQTAIVSCGRGSNDFAGATAKRLARADIYRTDELGNLIAAIRDGSYRVLTNGTE